MNNFLSVVVVGLFICGCTSNRNQGAILDNPSTALQGKVLIKSVDSITPRILIRSIDNGPVLMTNQLTPKSEAWVNPGPHVISVMCEFKEHWGTELQPGIVHIDAKIGKIYELSGTLGSDKCAVVARAQ